VDLTVYYIIALGKLAKRLHYFAKSCANLAYIYYRTAC